MPSNLGFVIVKWALSNVIIKKLLESERGTDFTQSSGEEAWKALVKQGVEC